MAAKHPGVSREIRAALGDHPERGTLARLAEAVGVHPPAVTRWYKQESSPDPALWVAIEDHLDMRPGTLELSAAGDSTPGQPTRTPATPATPPLLGDPTNGELLSALERLKGVADYMVEVLVMIAESRQIPLPTRPVEASAVPVVRSGRRKGDRP